LLTIEWHVFTGKKLLRFEKDISLNKGFAQKA